MVEHEIDNAQVNIAPVTPNMIAIAMDIKAQQVSFYSCGFTSGQGTFLANYGTFYLSGCQIEGSSDFFGAMEQRLLATRSLFPTPRDIQLQLGAT
jgi:hypothetical protein